MCCFHFHFRACFWKVIHFCMVCSESASWWAPCWPVIWSLSSNSAHTDIVAKCWSCRILHAYPVFFRWPCQTDKNDHIYMDQIYIWTELIQGQTGESGINCMGSEKTCRLLNLGGRWQQTVMWISAMLGHSNQRLSSACIYCVNAC